MTDGQSRRILDAFDRRFDRLEQRVEPVGKSMVAQDKVFSAVFLAQGVFFAGALAMLAVANSFGMFGQT